MICEKELKELCNKYNIRYQHFPTTKIILLDSGLDEWQVKYDLRKQKKGFCLLHRNKFRNKSKYHTQRELHNIFQVIDCVGRHKNLIINLSNLVK